MPRVVKERGRLIDCEVSVWSVNAGPVCFSNFFS